VADLGFMDRQQLEKLFEMSGGYVLNFNDRTFQEFVADAVQLDIHDDKYCRDGTSKARKLRQFWKLESDYTVGTLLKALADYCERRRGASAGGPEVPSLIDDCRKIADRLLSGGPRLEQIEVHADRFDSKYLKDQLRRMDSAVDTDPSLAIGTAKELVETCCKTILDDPETAIDEKANIPSLVKQTLKQLDLVPDEIDDGNRGAEATKRIVQGLASVVAGLAELRNAHGTGHGKKGRHRGLAERHARLAVGASACLVGFLFDTHQERRVEEAGAEGVS